jgi:hypothetical protein
MILRMVSSVGLLMGSGWFCPLSGCGENTPIVSRMKLSVCSIPHLRVLDNRQGEKKMSDRRWVVRVDGKAFLVTYSLSDAFDVAYDIMDNLYDNVRRDVTVDELTRDGEIL